MRSTPEEFTHALRAACYAHPSQRTTQVLINALGGDPYQLEDEKAISLLYQYAHIVFLREEN